MERQCYKTEDKLHQWSQRMLAPYVEDWTDEQLLALHRRIEFELDRRYKIVNYEYGKEESDSSDHQYPMELL